MTSLLQEHKMIVGIVIIVIIIIIIIIILQEHQLIVGIVVIADPGTVPINSRQVLTSPRCI